MTRAGFLLSANGVLPEGRRELRPVATDAPPTAPSAPLWLGRELRLLRTIADLTARDVARRAGIDRTLLSHIEAGRRPITPERAVRILSALAPAATETDHRLASGDAPVPGVGAV
jgi:DNA-binding XRE family transcriptional regulator